MLQILCCTMGSATFTKPESVHMSKYSTSAFLKELHLTCFQSRQYQRADPTLHPSGRCLYDACLASSIFCPLIAMRVRILSKPGQRHSIRLYLGGFSLLEVPKILRCRHMPGDSLFQSPDKVAQNPRVSNF